MGKCIPLNWARGQIDYALILRGLPKQGSSRYFIEQEEFDIDPMQALRIDAEYLRKLRV